MGEGLVTRGMSTAELAALSTDAERAAAIAAHEADTTSVHGIADTSALLTQAQGDAAYAPGTNDANDNLTVFGYEGNSIEAGIANTLVGGGLSGSENTITGDSNYRTLVGGYDNTIGANIASGIIHGMHSTISGTSNHAVIVGGSTHTITADAYGAIVGGFTNTVSGSQAAVIGGNGHTASGSQSAIIGGNGGTASGANSVIVGTTGATASAAGAACLGGVSLQSHGNGAAAVGGNTNVIGATGTTRGDYSAIVGSFSSDIGLTVTARFSGILAGRDNSINEEYSAIVGGQNNTVADGASHATALGHRASARLSGAFTHAYGMFAADGDAQSTVVVARKQTTDATATHLTLGGAAESTGTRLVIPTDTTWLFSALIVARRTDADGESAAYRVEGCIDNNAGTTALVGTPVVTVLSEDTATWDVAASANDTNDALRLTVTGEAAKTINWVARVELVEVTG